MSEQEKPEEKELCPTCKEEGTFRYMPDGNAIYNHIYCTNCGMCRFVKTKKEEYFEKK